MTRDLIRAIEQLGDRRIRRVIVLVVIITLAISAILIIAASVALGALELSGIGFVDWAIALLGGLAAAFIAWMLFPVIAAEVVYVFLDEVVSAVEARHYPHLPKATPVAEWRYVVAGIRLLLLMGVFNLLILPISFIPFANILYPALYLLINGILLGREFWEVVAPRRMSFAEAHTLRRRHRFKVFVSGIVIALLFLVPVFNLIAPVVATAFMVHVHRRVLGDEPGNGSAQKRA
jgi:uncharacterized protein involved in cysteine biosynthesis